MENLKQRISEELGDIFKTKVDKINDKPSKGNQLRFKLKKKKAK
jgi:hypothetical protein